MISELFTVYSLKTLDLPGRSIFLKKKFTVYYILTAYTLDSCLGLEGTSYLYTSGTTHVYLLENCC